MYIIKLIYDWLFTIYEMEIMRSLAKSAHKDVFITKITKTELKNY